MLRTLGSGHLSTVPKGDWHRRDGLARSSATLFLVCLSALSGCGREDVSGTAAPPKPVSIIDLSTGVPRSETLVAGVVEPYRQSDTSFDVSGLVTYVIDLGESAEGPQLDGRGELLLNQDGEAVRTGTVLARLDETRFRQAVIAAELSLASTDRQIDALKIELRDVYPARIASAEATASAAAADTQSARESVASAQAELDLARTTVERDRVLIESGAVAQSVLDQSESSFQTATASLAQARSALDAALQSESSASASLAETRGNLSVREADLASLEASRAELRNELERAQTDLDSSVLRAPFQGRVTARHIERGSFANAGTQIVELTMETAVKVVITVSADEERQIALGMQMPIYVETPGDSGGLRSFTGTVFEKASIADSGTRTFRIGLILPNPVLSDMAPGEAASVSDLFPVLSLPGRPTEDLWVNVAAAFERGNETLVLAMPRGDRTAVLAGTTQVPRAVAIEFTDEWEQLDTWSLRRIAPTAELTVGDPLVLNPTPQAEAGVVVGAAQYAFRPGDVVRVGLEAALPTPGFWVPATALVPRTGDVLLFIVRQGVAREVVVQVAESSGAFRRVSAADLSDGDSVVVRGMQYLSDGDAVTSSLAAGEGTP